MGFPWKPLLIYLGFVESFPLALELKATFSIVLFSCLKRMELSIHLQPFRSMSYPFESFPP